MYLDLKTLQLAAIVVCFVLGPVSLAFAPTQQIMQPSRFWGAGLIALALGLALGSLEGHAPNFISQVLGSGLVALALGFAHLSARSVAGGKVRDVTDLTLLSVFILTMLVLERMASLAWLRFPVCMAGLALFACRVAIAFDESKGLPEGRALRAIGGLFALFSVSLLLQAALGLASTEADANLGPGLTDALMLVGLIAGLLLGTMLLMWVMTERINSKVVQLVSLDPLTGALNRSAFIQQFEREVSRIRRRSVPQFGMLLIDIDQFHRVNDVSGNAAGDALLTKLVEILRGMTREYDAVGRVEGDVFVLLIPGADSANATRLAERVRREVELQAADKTGNVKRVTVSIGVAIFGEHGENWDTLLRTADSALKLAKNLGGNRVEGTMVEDSQP